ncbi:MAG: glycoside hydrolase family 3 C-terminal domain-containing protein, partial [Clostridia bacterium]|nr:glycoside hydrolase family 3 C-terminal domain-containing protein [Clostridia bacterium]
MLNSVTEYFSEVAVLLNVGNIIDMSWVEKYNIKSVMYIWHGGQEGGNAAADVITGKISPSGKLTDTIAKNLSDYPSYANFANDEECIYQEDIYVGYRYFETFAKEKVMYPFGFGLSYTDFDIKYSFLQKNDEISVSAKVKNTGNFNGKEVIQVYFEAPQGTIGVPSRQLCGFSKTRTLEAGEEETKIITFNLSQMSSFDDRKGAYILERGEYKIYAGTDVRNAVLVG